MVSPVHVGRALESLRNSDFNTVSAIGEVIDNSIEADAKNIRLRIKKREVRKGTYDLIEIAFGDNGVGMDKDTLSKCLQLGFSARYNNRKGIGRFGVGMTLGAITQCTRIEVYSKPAGGGWNLTYLDLEEMKGSEDPPIPTPSAAEIPREYADLVGETGTLVIWRNWDREDASVKDMIIWIGRTYRKFIGKEIIMDDKIVKNNNLRHIFLDDGEYNKEISAFDPLYVIKTDYNSEVTELEKSITFEKPVHKFDKPSESSSEGEIVIRSSLLPKSWREKRGTGNSTENNKRMVYGNEGISILRNGREVFYGHIPFFKIPDETSSHYKGFIDLDRFWGCEIEFDAVLDHWFSVKNIKVGARPIKEVREKIQDAFNPTIKEFRKEIRKVWKETADKEREKTSGKTTPSGDAAAKVVTSNNPGEVDKKGVEKDITQVIKDSGETKEEIRKALEERLAKNILAFIESYDLDERGNFIDIVKRGSRTILTLNMKHPFFRKFDELMNQMEQQPKRNNEEYVKELKKEININLKLLLGSFALAQNEINLNSTQNASDLIEKLIMNWTFHLKKNASTTLEKQEE